MSSLFPTEKRAPQPAWDRDEIPEGVSANFWVLLDWFTPNIFVCWIIFGINILVFAAMLVSGSNPDHASSMTALKWGADYGPWAVTDGQWWRVISCLFVHFGIVHVGCNMAVLYQIGPLMERLLGNVGFLIVYLMTGIAGAICSLALNPYVVSAGASGAIFGLFGALIGFLILRRDSIPKQVLTSILVSATIFLVYNGVFGMLTSGVDLAAHGGGLLIGLVCGFAVSTPITAGFRRRRLVRAVQAGLGCALALGGVTTQLPRPVDVQAEIRKMGTVEHQVLTTYIKVIRSLRQGNEDQIANELESQVISPWKAERASLGRFQGLPAVQQSRVLAFLAYMDTRQEGWEKVVGGLRKKSALIMSQGFAEERQAQETLKQYLGK